MTLAEYREAVREDLDDDEYSASVIDRAINDYIKEIAARSRLRRLEASEDLFLSTGDYEVEFPEDLLVLLNLSVTSPSPARRIFQNFVEYNQFTVDNPGYASQTSRAAANVDWTDFGGGMRLSAPVNAATTVACEYIRSPERLVEDEDENELDPNDNYSEMFILGAKARAMERNEDYAEARQERRKLQPLETTFIKNEGRGTIKVGPTVIKTNRGRRSGYRADRDF